MPMLSRRLLLAAGLASGALVSAARPASAAPEPDLWPRWTAHDPASTLTVDHAAWNGFLARYRSEDAAGVARVNYRAVTPADRAALDGYLDLLQTTPVDSLSRPEQFAYWTNFYNALTVKVILDHYPVDSIRDIDISPGLFSNGPWGAKLVSVAGEELSLDDIEHRILRPIWQDPRIHYAVNCAAIGCPNLLPQALRPATLEADLEAAARAYVNDPRGARIDDDGDLVVSSIYDWFQEDFDDSEIGVLAHLRRYADGPLAAALAGRTRIDDDDYDWSLNETNAVSG